MKIRDTLLELSYSNIPVALIDVNDLKEILEWEVNKNGQ